MILECIFLFYPAYIFDRVYRSCYARYISGTHCLRLIPSILFNSMIAYRRTKWFILGAVLFYFIVGNGARYWLGREIYPIFSWELFSYVPNELVDYGLRVTQVDHKVLPKAVYFEAAPSLFSDAQSIIAYNNIQALGQLLDAHQADNAQAARIKVEQQHLHIAHALSYEIIRRSSIPLVRWKTGSFATEVVIANFETSP